MKTCADCGRQVREDAPDGLCPTCLFERAAGALDTIVEPNSEAGLDRQNIHGAQVSACFGDYELLEEIARGGMGVVYKARQRSLNRVVAMKMILAGQFATKEFVQRFRAEAAAAAALQHPNIVAVHDVGVQDGQHYFSMDYIQGQNLVQLVGNRPLPAKKAAAYLQKIAEAIHYAHNQGVLHRDLKPSNILVDFETDQPRVTDFGLAKRIDGESSLTLTGQVLGSPHFMSPEQASAERGKLRRETDVYALGGILFYLLTARAPFQGDTLERTLHSVLNTEPLSPRTLNPSVPADLETICLKCLEKDQGKRYATAKELSDELGRFLNDEPVNAQPVNQAERAWRWCRRKPALAGSLAIAGTLLVVVAVGSPIAALSINREARRAEAGETAFRLRAYVADMNVAHIALQEHNLARALRSLDAWIPTNSTPANSPSKTLPDLRGWEWRYLRSQCHGNERATLLSPAARHSGAIVSVAYSPDGKWLASASHDGRVKLIELSTRSLLAEFQHKKEVRAVTFSPLDSKLVTLCADGWLRFWEPKTRANLSSVPANANAWIGAVAFSSNGAYIAFSSPIRGSVTVSNLALRTSIIIEAHADVIGALAFSPDGGLLATYGWDGLIKLWDVATHQLKHELSETVLGSTLDISPDGRQLVSTSIDQTWKLWDTETGRLLHAETFHMNGPTAALFLRDGKGIAVANDNYTISLWTPTDNGWKEQDVLKGHQAPVWALALSPDGKELASGSSAYGEVKLWSTSPPAPPSNWMPCPAIRRPWAIEQPTFAFSTDAGKFLTSVQDGTIELWDSASLTKTVTLSWPETNTMRFALHSDGKFIASADRNGTVQLWSVAGQSVHEERSMAFSGNVYQLTFSPNGQMLAGISDSICVLWDIESGRRLLELNQEGTYSLRFSPDSQWLASTGRDGKVKLWQVANPQCLWTRAHEGTATDAAFFPDGRLVSGGWVMKATMWDRSGRELAAFQGQMLGADSVAVSPDGRRVAMGCGEGAVKLFLLDGAGQPLDVLTLPCQQAGVWRVAFLPDGETIVAACRGGVQVWRAPTIEEIAAKEKMHTSLQNLSSP